MPRTENARQTLAFLRPGDGFSVGSVHFKFLQTHIAANKMASDMVQVESSGHGLLLDDKAQRITQGDGFIVDINTICSEPAQATAVNIVPTASMVKESENTVFGVAVTPSFAELPPVEHEHNARAESGSQDSLSVTENVADSMEIVIGSSRRRKLSIVGDSVLPPVDQSPHGTGDESEGLINQAMEDAAVENITDILSSDDDSGDKVATTPDRLTLISQASLSQPNSYVTCKTASEVVVNDHDQSRHRSKDLDLDDSEHSALHALPDIANETSPEILMLTPAVINSQAHLSSVQVVPPMRPDEVYEVFDDEKYDFSPAFEKTESEMAYEDNDTQQESMRSTIHMQSSPLNKRRMSLKQRQYTNKSRTIRCSSGSRSNTSQTQDVAFQSSPETVSTTSSSQVSTLSRGSHSMSSKRPVNGHKTCICFSSSSLTQNLKSIKVFFNKNAIRTVKSVDECTHFCVGSQGELKKTSNLVKAVMNGKDVVSDRWLTASAHAGHLLNPSDYIPRTPSDWDTELHEAIARGRHGIRVLSDFSVFFTEDAKDALGSIAYEDVRDIALAAGAVEVRCVGQESIKGGHLADRVIYIASGADDVDWDYCVSEDLTVYTRDVVLMSILRGRLDLESAEFVVRESGAGMIPATGKGKKKRKRLLS